MKYNVFMQVDTIKRAKERGKIQNVENISEFSTNNTKY